MRAVNSILDAEFQEDELDEALNVSISLQNFGVELSSDLVAGSARLHR